MPNAIEVVKIPGAIMEQHPRFKMLFRGQLWGEIYYNMRGFIPSHGIPIPVDYGTGVGTLSIGEVSLTIIKREIVRANQEWKMRDRQASIPQELVKIAKSLLAVETKFYVHGLGLGRGLRQDPFVESSEDRLVRTLAIIGIHKIGVETNPSRRPELQGCPKFDQLLGPMWNGPGKIRYETKAVYDALSY